MTDACPYPVYTPETIPVFCSDRMNLPYDPTPILLKKTPVMAPRYVSGEFRRPLFTLTRETMNRLVAYDNGSIASHRKVERRDIQSEDSTIIEVIDMEQVSQSVKGHVVLDRKHRPETRHTYKY